MNLIIKDGYLIGFVKIALAASFLILLGLPVVELWKMLVLVAGWLALACSRVRVTRARGWLSVGVVVGVVLVRAVLPVAAIEEGHNIFLVTRVGTVLRDGLPQTVYDEWRRAFEQRYPPDKDTEAVWRTSFPTTLYAWSSDAFWRTARYSRTVDTVSFRTLSDFRGGFANDTRYNFYGSDALSLTRGFQADLPFFVMYEFSPESVGSTLFWQGTVFWEGPDGSLTELAHARDAGRVITAADTGKKAYALHLPVPLAERFWERRRDSADARPLTALSMHLELGPALVASRWIDGLLAVGGVLGLLVLMTRVNRDRYLMAVGIVVSALVIVGLVIHFSEGKYLGATYPPHGGGDDGLSHDFGGRAMAREFMTGNWREALRSGQDIYFDTPGMRHARTVEKLIFGDTNLGYTAVVALLPWFIFVLIRQLAGVTTAVAAVLFFLLSPVGSLSYLQYLQNAKLGYAEAMAFSSFILGMHLLFRARAQLRRANVPAAFVGGLCLAGGMFLRPNLALAVAALGLAFVVASWRSGDFKAMAFAMAGLAFALWMPVHNYLFGRQFVLMTLGGNLSITLSPMTYLRAASEMATGHFAGEHSVVVANQVASWLWTLPRLPVASLQPVAEGFMALKLVTLAVTLFAAARYARGNYQIGVLAWTALAAHLPMLFLAAPNSFRYAMMGWDLSAIVTIAVAADYVHRRYAAYHGVVEGGRPPVAGGVR